MTRSEEEKWRVPEVDPAADTQPQSVSAPRSTPQAGGDAESDERGNLIFCGMCGALNPVGRYYCAACGTTLVDAFHATEGLRVFERPDAASPIIEIVPSGVELDLADDPDAPTDYARIRLSSGRLGYIRLSELASRTRGAAPITEPGKADPNTAAYGCVSPTAAIASLVLLIMLSSLGIYLLSQEGSADSGFLALVMCAVVAPLAIMMIMLYLMAREREDRRIDELADQEADS